ncbi:MAG: hypothetical protein LBQ52_10085 [Helicobacteraceae bacterium]|jgi:hypothetical protein|nr:hypothetical protein [Helicobacteraceae bacterium]
MAENNETKTTGTILSDIAKAVFGGEPKEQFIKGALLGGAVAFLLTNKTAQEAIFKTIVRLGTAGAEAFEEMKDRFEEAKAQVEAEQTKEG